VWERHRSHTCPLSPVGVRDRLAAEGHPHHQRRARAQHGEPGPARQREEPGRRRGLTAAANLDLTAYDVVVLDRDLSGLHGDVLCQMITERADLPMVLMLTAAGAPGDRVSGLPLGADDYLAKPFHFPELILRIRALARRKPEARPLMLRAAGIELDPVRRTVVRDGRQLNLSVKEFAVLEALLQASPGFLSAEALLERVWDENADRFTNTVTVTVGRLRRKLGEPPIIVTTPGIGYRIA
jgi:DNA-binding response OmpR family regulator